MIKTTFADFFRFIKHPDDKQLEFNFIEKLRVTLILFTAIFILNFVLILPLLDVLDRFLSLAYVVDIDNLPSIHLFLFVVITIPFLEELLFRHFLRYQGIKTFLLSAKQWRKVFPFLVYLSAICFGFIHLSNYTNADSWFYILSPLVIISQLIAGIVISYIRVRLDFLWGVAFHSCWNFVAIFVLPVVEEFLGII